MSRHMPDTRLSTCLDSRPSTCLDTRLSTCLDACLSIYLDAHLSTCLDTMPEYMSRHTPEHMSTHLSGLGLGPSDPRYAAGVNFVAAKIARALVCFDMSVDMCLDMSSGCTFSRTSSGSIGV